MNIKDMMDELYKVKQFYGDNVEVVFEASVPLYDVDPDIYKDEFDFYVIEQVKFNGEKRYTLYL